MSLKHEESFAAIRVFEPGPNVTYSIEVTERIAHVPRRTIALYYKHGLVSPIGDPNRDGFYFDDEGVRILRRIESMRTTCGANLAGIKMILSLLNEVQRLRTEARFLRRQ